ncbi:MAG TPA: adenylate/guanylate cyclase domain-containing protein [Streptosporangiaceae bacterium]|nr:adenylate/guanylate cyclase domain-containing protein [Streptosporangiaceae bacterium]
METLTFLFTDIEGSTNLLRRLGESSYARVLADHHSVIRSALAAHDGQELNTLGDGFFAAFASPRKCIAAVTAIQRTLEAHPWPAGERVRVRMGVHTGEAAQTTSGMLGLDVHRAARIAAAAHGGQVLLSETAAALVRDSLPADEALKDLGFHRLKDLGRPEQIFQLLIPGLQVDFPPLQSLGNPALQNNLPIQAARFVGRDRELTEVRSLVESSRLVTLTGAGGSGKTRLSLQVAADMLDGSGDGVWLVELATVTDEEDVPAAVSAALGIDTRSRRPVVDSLVDALVPQRTLIVLDNCEHLIGACAKVADNILRHCPRVHLLATSREPLGIGGETLYRVPSLSLPASDEEFTAVESSDAIALLIDRARDQGVEVPADERTTSVMASICRRLDGMPLAIELAAARLRSLSLTELRDRLDQRFRLLTGGSRTAMARQQTLLATVDWSYALLTRYEQLLLRRLSVFQESFDLAAAEAVCGFGDIERFEVTDLLGSLVDKSLVMAEQSGGTTRYRMLETIRQFAAERSIERDESDARDVAAAHCAHYLSVAEAAEPHLTGAEQGRWLARLDLDYPNIKRATVHAASDLDGTKAVLRFAVALRRYWMSRDADDEVVNLLSPVLDRPDAESDPGLFAAATITSLIAKRGNDQALTLRRGSHVMQIARGLGDDRLLVEALAIMCSSSYFAGNPEDGLPYGEESLAIARRTGDDVLLTASLTSYLLCKDVVDPVRSEALYAEAIACTQRSGDRMFAYLLHNNVGVHALRAGDLADAREHFERAAVAMAEIGEKSHHVSVNLGWVLREEGNPAAARPLFEAGMRMSRRTGSRNGSSYALMALACVAADFGEWHRAGELHGAAQAMRDRIEEPWEDPEDQYRRDSLSKLRANLGDAEADRAIARGMQLSFDDAFNLAIGAAR